MRALRRMLDLSQEMLGLRAGVHLNLVGRLERGADARLSTVLALAGELGGLTAVALEYEARLARALEAAAGVAAAARRDA